jgi:sulfite reductase (ferredoxin)
MAEAERYLPDLITHYEALQVKHGIDKDAIVVRMTGCPNGCARPYMAELGLVGSGPDQYQLWLGGTPNLSRLAEPYLERMPLPALESTLEPLLRAWLGAGGRRSFGDFVAGSGRDAVSALLTAS